MITRQRKINGRLWTFYWDEKGKGIKTDLGQPTVYNSVKGFNLCFNGSFTGHRIEVNSIEQFKEALELWIFNYKRITHNAKRKQQYEANKNDKQTN